MNINDIEMISKAELAELRKSAKPSATLSFAVSHDLGTEQNVQSTVDAMEQLLFLATHAAQTEPGLLDFVTGEENFTVRIDSNGVAQKAIHKNNNYVGSVWMSSRAACQAVTAINKQKEQRNES